MDKKSRSTVEMNDTSCRPANAQPVKDMEQYDTILIGFSIWWYVEPRIVDMFLGSYDFSGKTFDPICHLRWKRNWEDRKEPQGTLLECSVEKGSAFERNRSCRVGKTNDWSMSLLNPAKRFLPIPVFM